MYQANSITEDESRIIKYLRMVFIIMVLFLHSYQERINLTTGTVEFDAPNWFKALKWGISFGISDVAVPGFFMLSAYILYKKGYKYAENLKKKCRRLLIPYLLMNTFWIAFFAVVQRMPALSVFFTNEDFLIANWSVLDWINAYTGFWTGSPILYPLWFVLNLMSLNLLASVFEAIIHKYFTVSCMGGVLAWIFIDSSNIFCLRITAVCAWGFGCILAKIQNDRSLQGIDTSEWCQRLGSGLTVGRILLVYVPVLAVDILLRNWIYHVLIHRISVLLGLVFWYAVAKWRARLDVSPVVKVMSDYSFGIYIFHEMNMSIFQKICGKLLPTSIEWQALEYLLIPFIILICCLVLCSLLKKISVSYIWAFKMYREKGKNVN